jgi:hypothetical protein
METGVYPINPVLQHSARFPILVGREHDKEGKKPMLEPEYDNTPTDIRKLCISPLK